jgi:hypothetical protein
VTDDAWTALVAYAGTLPAGSVLPVSREVLLDAENRLRAGRSAPPAELSAKVLADELGKKPATARAWCEQGLFPNATKLRGEWRIPRSDVTAFLESQRERPTFTGHPVRPRVSTGSDLSAWRKGAA